MVELLVAITIIVIISIIGMATFAGIRGKSQDGVRKNALAGLATALELYYRIHGEYLINTGSCTSTPPTATDVLYTDTEFAKLINNSLPKDPKTGSNYCYQTDAAGDSFKLYAKLEDGTDYIISSD